MAKFDMRRTPVEAMQFAGSPASAIELIEWAKVVAPRFVVRERIASSGWNDRDGHLELELSHGERQAMEGDWIVFIDAPVGHEAWVLTDAEFQRHFQPTPVP